MRNVYVKIPFLFESYLDLSGVTHGATWFDYVTNSYDTFQGVTLWFGRTKLDFDPDERCKPLCWLLSKIPARDYGSPALGVR